MRAAEGLHIEWVEDEAVVLDPETRQLHHLNATAALVFALIQEEGFDAALGQLNERFSEDPNFREELALLLEALEEKGLLTSG